jgi:hypothetical protein
MSSLVIAGDTSGQVTIAAPAVAGTTTLTLQAATATNAVNTLATAVASTSGTSIDFTGLPSWIKRITVMFSGVSTNATTNGATASSTVGVLVGYRGDAANVYSGAIVFTLLNASSNLWVAQGVNSGAGGSTGEASSVGATKTLSGTLDRVRITTVNGTDTFDAGTVNILYEG